MKKASSKKNVVTSNHKISAFFTKIPNSGSNTSTNLHKSDMKNEDTDDIIPGSPVVVRKTDRNVLNPITNTNGTRKRKVVNNDSNKKLDPFFIRSPPTKRNNLDSMHDIVIKNDMATCSKKLVTTPKKVERTPQKVSPQKSSRTTRKSPLKNRSVNISDFKVELIENLATITPSKSSIKSNNTTPSKSPSMKQSKILDYISPSTSSRSTRAQSDNEKTPERLVMKTSNSIINSKAKINLNNKFLNSPTTSSNVLQEETLSQKSNKTEVDIIDFLDFDETWELSDVEFSLDLSISHRCKLIEYIKEKNNVTIIVESCDSCHRAKCILEGFWIWCKLDIGRIIHIKAVKRDYIWKVTNEQGLLVYEPDILISNTAVVGALFCKRRSVFKEKFMGFESENKVMVIGVLVHTLLQNVLKMKAMDVGKIEDILNKLLSQHSTIRLMYNCSLTEEDLRNELNQFIPRIVKFMEDYVSQNRSKISGHIENNWSGTIDNILDIEENIWCPELGVKGKVDISISANTNVMPVELKTGRATVSLEHRGQVMLYILMMKKLGYKVSSGLLLYLRDGILREIPYSDKEKRDLILLRNDLTYYLTRRVQKSSNENPLNNHSQLSWTQKLNALKSADLPEPINHHSACEKCPYNILCCSYLKYNNEDLTSNKVLNSIKNQGLSHLTDFHIQYFIHFSNLLDLEAKEGTGKGCADIYTKTPEQRESLGKCIPFLKITEKVIECDNFYEHTFKRIEDLKSFNFLVCGIGESSYVVVSTNERPAVSAGLVNFIDHDNIVVALDRDLSSKFPNSTFHIDTYNTTSIFSFNFASLSIGLEPTEQGERIRKLIIDKTPPTFKVKLPKIVATKAPAILKNLNRTQQRAVLKALGANDYLLINGMPGAGKTATIVALIQILVEIGNSVLITSHTHAAVDNVCLRLKKCDIKVLRLGAQGRIHHDIKSMSEYELTKDCKTPEDFEKIYANAQVIAVTCLGTKHPIFNKRGLDVCIVDESTQLIQCSLFRVLSAAKKFILVGDPDQLPPLVRNEEAITYGLSESLFERLNNPSARVTLNLNYRMNKTITALANSFMYKGELQVANDDVGNAVLQIPNLNDFLRTYKDQEWITTTLNQSLENAVRVLDTGAVWQKDLLNSIHNDGGKSYNVNVSEIAVISSLINALLNGGIKATSIGIISPYTAQVAQLSATFKENHIDISTVDQFQGRDKEIIIFSCTLSRNMKKPFTISQFHILQDRRRLNVALTRAKYKFVLIGDLECIKNYTPFKDLLGHIPERCFIRLTEGEKGFSLVKIEKEL